MKRHRIMFWAGAGCVAWGLIGCSVSSAPSGSGTTTGSVPSIAAGPLRGTAVPASFKFATVRGVPLTLNADKSLFSGKGVAAIEVTNAAHAVLFQGPMRMGQALVVPLAVPSKDDSVNVTFRAKGAEQTSSVAIVNDRASHVFQ